MLTNKEIKQRYFQKKRDAAPMIECFCGCGNQLKSIDNYGRPVTFVNGHNKRQYEITDNPKWENQKRYRKNNPDKIRNDKRERYRKLKLKAMTVMNNKCDHCNIVYDGTNAPIFEFHHLDPTQKDNGVTRMFSRNKWETVLIELKKCILICANCHNKEHGGKW